MKPKKNIIGVRFHAVVVIGATDRRCGRGHIIYTARCDCGTEFMVAGRSLRSGGTRSCGCLRRAVAKANIARLPRDDKGRLQSGVDTSESARLRSVPSRCGVEQLGSSLGS